MTPPHPRSAPSTPPESIARSKVIFLEALTIEHAGERAAFIARETDGDEPLRDLVLELLAADDSTGGLMDAGPDALMGGPNRSTGPGMHWTAPAPDRPGEIPMPTRLGGRRILRVLGAGGMGQVFAARAESDAEPGADDGGLGEEVAVKLVHADAGVESMARFRREIALLRRLDHPAIARVLDSGVHDDGLGGRPWYAMQLVAGGRPIDEWAAERPRDPEVIATMIAQVADAVAHAHERGVIHRDLKTANILVGDDDQPRVIDFGVARLRESAATGDGSGRLDTRSGQLLGSLTTIPPEQFLRREATLAPAGGSAGDREARESRHPADVRGDVYALGIVLYELLTGRLPWPLTDVPAYEIPRIVREQPPTRPSVIRPALRGDLESIVLTAIEREPARRYASPAALAADLRHWLAGEAIAARRDHALQSMRRRVRQHRLTLALLAVLLVSLAAVGVLLSQRVIELDRRTAALLRQEAFTALHLAADAADAGDPVEARRLLEVARPLQDSWTWRHVERRATESIAVPQRHLGGGIVMASFSPEADRVALVDDEGRLRIIDTRDGSLVTPLGDGARDREVIDLCWDGAGDALSATFADGGATLLPVPRGESFPGMRLIPARRLDSEGHAISRIELQFLGTGGLLQVDEAGVLAGFPGGSDAAWTRSFAAERPLEVRVSPGGDSIAVADRDGTLTMLDGATGEPRWRQVRAYREAPRSATFSPDGRMLHVGTRDGRLDAWDVADGRSRRIATVPMSIRAISVSPSGRRIAYADARTIHVRTVGTGAMHSELANDGHEILALQFEGDDDCLQAMHGTGELRRWNLADRQAVRVVDARGAEGIDAVQWSGDGRHLAITRRDGRLELRDASGRRLLATAPLDDGRVWQPRFSGDGSRIAGLVSDYPAHRIGIWSVPDLRLVATLLLDGTRHGLEWIPGTRTIIVARADGAVLAIDTDPADGPPVPRTLLEPGDGGPGDRQAHDVLALDPATGRIAVGTIDGPVLLARLVRDGGDAGDPDPDHGHWRLTDHRWLLGHAATPQVAAFSPDGSRLISGDGAGIAQVWDVASGTPLVRLPRARGDLISGVAWLDDGQWLAVAGFDGPVSLHEAAGGRRISTLAGSARRVAFDPHREVVASVDAVDDSWLRLYASRPDPAAGAGASRPTGGEHPH